MNLLQIICNEESERCLIWLSKHLKDNPKLKSQMASYRDTHLGSQAIHLASTTGNRQIIETLIN